MTDISKANFTFKKQPRQTGLSAIANPHPFTNIRLLGEDCGNIIPPSRFGKEQDLWRVGLMVKKPEPDSNPNCDWTWVHFKARFKTEAEAREWLKKNQEELKAKFTIHLNGRD